MATSASRLFDSLKPLWLMLTGGAFVSFAGGALTLLYFWGIGGVPIGQAAGASTMAKVVLPTATLLAIAFMMVWLVPTIASLMFADEQSFAATLRRLFACAEGSHVQPTVPTPPPQPALNWEVVADEAPQQSSSEHPAAHPIATPTPHSPVDRLRILLFSLLTVGVGCGAIILYALTADQAASEGWGSYAGKGSVALWVATVASSLAFLWRRFNKTSSVELNGKKYHLSEVLGWHVFGLFSSAASVAPLLSLLLVFLKSDRLLESESATAFALGALAISFGIVVAYAVSLWALVERSQGKHTKWVFLLGLNAAILGFMAVSLGLSSRMLEAVMVLASVRVESAIVTLEPEGCELLESMGARGWGYTAKGSKICVMPDVTIQSTLEPAMQIACWRGTIPKAKTEAGRVAASAASASSSTSQAMAAASTSAAVVPDAMLAPSAHAVALDTTQVSGRRGVFSMPVKYVRSVWKTGGIASSSREALCTTQLEFHRPSEPAEPASAASSTGG